MCSGNITSHLTPHNYYSYLFVISFIMLNCWWLQKQYVVIRYTIRTHCCISPAFKRTRWLMSCILSIFPRRLQSFTCKVPIYSGIYVKLSSKDKTDDKQLGHWYQMIGCWEKLYTQFIWQTLQLHCLTLGGNFFLGKTTLTVKLLVKWPIMQCQDSLCNERKTRRQISI